MEKQAFVYILASQRNGCLNQHWFRSLHEAEHIIEQWREHYNTVRPHSSLGYVTPVAFAKKVA